MDDKKNTPEVIEISAPNGEHPAPAQATSAAEPKPEPAKSAKSAPQPIPDPSFWSLIGVHFQTVFCDFTFKFMLVMMVLNSQHGSPESGGVWLSILIGVCALPYILLAGWAGVFADRFSKPKLILASKIADAGIFFATSIAFYFLRDPEKYGSWMFYSSMIALLMLSTIGSFYGPSRYALIPVLLPARRLAFGNGMMELATYAGVFLGMFAGTGLHGLFGMSNMYIIPLMLSLLAFGGIIPARMIESVPPAQKDLKFNANPLPRLWDSIRFIMKDRIVLYSVVGVAYFWALGALVVANAPFWGTYALGLELVNPYFPGLLIVPIAIGMAAGGVMVGMLSRKTIELGFIPLGGLAVALFAIPLGLPHHLPSGGDPHALAWPFTLGLLVCLALMGASAAFFYVPLNSWIQERVPRPDRGGVLATGNFFNFFAIILALLHYFLLRKFFLFNPSNIFVLCSILTFTVTLFLVTLMPEVLLGMVTTVITRFVYRIKVLGGENIPREGAALLVSNHVSMVDALLISAISPRPVRFIVWKEIFDNPILGYFLKIMGAIPVASDTRPRALIASLGLAADALNRGELVCIFAEGQVTRAGLMLPFRRGFKHILGRAPVPVVPVYLEGVWGTIFAYEKKQVVWRLPRKFPYHVRAAVGKALPHDVSMHDMRQSVQELSADCAFAKKDHMKPVHHRFLAYARQHGKQFCVSDSLQNIDYNYFATAVGGIAIARRLKALTRGQEMVGLLLPPAAVSVFANIGVALAGKTAVNLNYTVGPDILRHCIKQCNIKTVVTSRLFLKKLEMEPPPGAVFIDEMLKAKPLSKVEKLTAALAFKLLPTRALESFCGATSHPDMDSLFTIIFSSGSTGMPKGVMLTQFNIASNIESIEQAVALWSDDKMIGFLPFFHSFGYTVALWGALCIGFGVVHHPNPLEAKPIGDLVEKHKITLMVATPTFLQSYIRRVEPEKFATLEFILTGAEKLPNRIAEAFAERFGVAVHEGYGTTECAPVVSANSDDYRSRGFYNIGHKRGTVGHAFPGICVRIVNVDTGELMPGGEAGMIQVRGANIMKGYLAMPEKTAEVIKPGGWYETGDVGFIDDEGFIHITDRLARFSKIGGEMVPHVRIEDELHKALEITGEQVFAVTAVPDDNKGEKLIVLHTIETEKLEGLSEKLADAGLPNLWIPRKSNFFKIDVIPVLGSGKMDLGEVKRTAARFASGEAVPAGKT